jgi:hypothetical protein
MEHHLSHFSPSSYFQLAGDWAQWPYRRTLVRKPPLGWVGGGWRSRVAGQLTPRGADWKDQVTLGEVGSSRAARLPPQDQLITRSS